MGAPPTDQGPGDALHGAVPTQFRGRNGCSPHIAAAQRQHLPPDAWRSLPWGPHCRISWMRRVGRAVIYERRGLGGPRGKLSSFLGARLLTGRNYSGLSLALLSVRSQTFLLQAFEPRLVPDRRQRRVGEDMVPPER